jgi:PAS domain S-box-containing protein
MSLRKLAKPTSLARQGLLLILLPIIWLISLVVGLNMISADTEDYAYRHDNYRLYNDAKSGWLASFAVVSDRAANAVEKGELRDTAECERHLARMHAYAQQLKPPVMEVQSQWESMVTATNDVDRTFHIIRMDVMNSLLARDPQARIAWRHQAGNLAVGLNNELTAYSEQEDMKGFLMSSRYRSEERQRWTVALTAAMLVNLGLLMLIARFFNRSIINRLATISYNSAALATGTPLRPPLKGNDEIAVLDESFRDMAEAVKESSRAQTVMISNSRDIICSLDEHGRFLAASDASLAMLGHDSSHLVGTFLADLVADADQTHAIEHLREIEKRGQDVFEIALRRRDGNEIDTLWSVTWSSTDRSIFCVVRDNSPHKAAERLQRQVVQMVSHDLRSPLTAIRGFYEMIGSGMMGQLTSQGSQMLAMAISNCTRMNALTDDLLDIEKLDAGKIQLELEDTDVDAIVRDAIQTVAMQAAKKSIALKCQDQQLHLHADPRRLTQVLINLLTNAIKFTPERGEILISCRQNIGSVSIEVADNGRGIPQADLPYVFDRFRQSKAEDATVHGGKGLGLAICKALVELHGGTIAVRSVEGSGSVFSIELPAQSVIKLHGDKVRSS